MVKEEISALDGMFDGNRDHYFAVGRSALRCIEVAMLAAGKKELERILDLPCGFGRVLRHLQSAFPGAQLTACDIIKEGVDFCAATFNAIPAYGQKSPDQIRLEGNYDLIWVGSLLTHFGNDDCTAFLEFFRANLRDNGLLVFTTHGRTVARRLQDGVLNYGLDSGGLKHVLKQYAMTGFGYANYPASIPGIGENYGVSLSSPCWVYKVIDQMPGMRLINYTEQGWDDHQDVVSLIRV
jgi:SAM-dependent methyltransferase